MAEKHAGVESIATIPVETVRNALLGTMVMGMSNVESERPTFFFERQLVWTDHDSMDKPWDWTTAPLSDTTAPSVQPIVAIEFFSPLGRQGGVNTEVGEFNPTTAIFTLVDTELPKLVGFTYATVGNSTQRWYFRFWRPAIGLGGLTIYQVHTVAEGID